MSHCHLIVSGVARELGRLEEQFQIHHVVDDDGTFPAPFRLPAVSFHVPALDDLGLLVETCAERLGRLDHHVLIFFLMAQAETVAVAAVDDEADVMVPGEITGLIKSLGVFLCQRQQRGIAGQFIQIPHAAGEEPAPPVGIAAVIYFTLVVQSNRIETFSACLNRVNLQSDLCPCVFNGFLLPVSFRSGSLLRAGCHGQ